MTSYEIVLNDGEEILTTDDGLFDVPELRDTFNPFANVGVAVFDDRDGNVYDKFPRGTRVDFQYADGISDPDTLAVNDGETEAVNDGETATHDEVLVGGDVLVGGTLDVGTRDRTERLQGFVVERREVEEAGADQLEVDVYSLDQLLRGDTVTENTSGKTILEALETIIVNDTPVTWNVNNVSVEDNVTVRRDLSGERVEEALLYLSFLSDNELIRVNDEIEFEFSEVEQNPAPRDIDNTQYFYADIPERGKGVINEVRVWFNDGEEQVTVDNGADKLALQDALGLDDPYSTVKELSRPDITTFDDAKAVGQQTLEELSTTTPVTVTTFGLETAEPGQVINVDIPEKGISGDFEIASLSYNWAADETDLILIENTEYQDDFLVRVSDAVERVEIRDVNRDADDNRVTDTRVEAEIDVTGDVNGATFDDTRLTNTARNKLRDGWGGGGTIDITQIAIGDDNSGLSRTNTALGNELQRVSVSETLSGSKAVAYDGSFQDADVQEVGLFDTDGDLIARGVVDTAVSGLGTLAVNDGETESVNDGETELYSEVLVGGDLNVGGTLDVSGVDATVTLTVSDNTDLERGVFTNDGQEAVRDVLADNSPALPTQYAYGQDGATPTESDTALGNQSIAVSLDEILVQNASSTSDWESIT